MNVPHHHTTARAGPAGRHARPTPSRTPLRAFAATAVLTALLGGTATLAYEAGRGTVAQVSAAAAAPVAPAMPVAAPIIQPPAVAEPGPVVVDTDGAPLPADIAKSVRIVYTALDTGDLDPIRAAYSATGSDDWLTTERHLNNAAIRKDVLAALQTAPTTGSDAYTYSTGGISAEFGWSSLGTGVGPGLHTITGPWIEDTTTGTAATTESVKSAAPTTVEETSTATSGCAADTLDQPSEGYPCSDPATGRGVTYDGTVGAHGLEPCPHGTELPTDPNEPTRNATTGEICGWDG